MVLGARPFRLLTSVASLLRVVLGPWGVRTGMVLALALTMRLGWARPELGKGLLVDRMISAAVQADAQSTADLVAQPRSRSPMILFGVGLGLVITGGVLAAYRPRWFGVLFGYALVGLCILIAVTMVDQPYLLELMDDQARQQNEIGRFLRSENPDSIFLALHSPAPDDPKPFPPLIRLSAIHRYMGLGPQVALTLTMAGLLLFSGHTWRERVRAVFGWSVLAVSAGLATIAPRIMAEGYMVWAEHLESIGQHARAADAMDASLRWAPQLESSTAHYRVRGRLDVRLGRLDTLKAGFFQAEQLARAGEWRRCLPAFEDLLRRAPQAEPVRLRLAQLQAQRGRALWRIDKTAPSISYWNLAYQTHPTQKAALFYLAVARAKLASVDPQPTLVVVDELTRWVGDQPFLAQVEATRGEALFAAGRFADARGAFRRSLKAMHMPKVRNIQAQRGLIGQ